MKIFLKEQLLLCLKLYMLSLDMINFLSYYQLYLLNLITFKLNSTTSLASKTEKVKL